MFRWMRLLNPWRHRRLERALDIATEWMHETYRQTYRRGRVSIRNEVLVSVQLKMMDARDGKGVRR